MGTQTARTARTADRLRAGVRPQGATLLATVLAAVLITSLVPLAVVVSEGRITAAELLSDPAEVTGAPWYLGALTSVTLLVWAAGAALHLVAGVALRAHPERLGAALTALGLVTLVFAADDAFLAHEILIPWILGIPEVVTYGIYGVVLLAVLVRYRSVLLRQPEASVLVLAVVAFGGSVALDVLGWDSTARRLAEEGLKLLGVLAWAVFPARIMVRSLRRVAADGRADASPGPRGL